MSTPPMSNFYEDSDGDGRGSVHDISLYMVSPQLGWTKDFGDCNDNDNKMYFGAPELCDGKDNDCDGVADEGGVCNVIENPKITITSPTDDSSKITTSALNSFEFTATHNSGISSCTYELGTTGKVSISGPFTSGNPRIVNNVNLNHNNNGLNTLTISCKEPSGKEGSAVANYVICKELPNIKWSQYLGKCVQPPGSCTYPGQINSFPNYLPVYCWFKAGLKTNNWETYNKPEPITPIKNFP